MSASYLKRSGLFLLVSFILAGFAAGYAARGRFAEKADAQSKMKEKREGGHKFISPLLECDLAEPRELRQFKDVVDEYIKEAVNRRRADKVSVYFRQLNDGQWFTIGDTEKFAPASLLKIPAMIAVLKHSETNPGFLRKHIKFDLMRDHNEYQNFKPSDVLKRGKEYTVEELVYRMIVYSDNNSMTLLTNNIDPANLSNVFCMLNMPTCYTTSPKSMDSFLSVYTYASFFRILYNASFLDRDLSEKALDYLVKTEFKDGLVAGVPGNIVVAHKFGEHADGNTGVKQLHDCGIVYYPRSPYLLCMMARGTAGEDFDVLAGTLASLSHIVFEEVDRQRQNMWQ